MKEFKEIVMTEKEWISYFEAINGRKPTPAELQDAVRRGEVSPLSPKASFSKWQMGLIGIGVLVVLGIIYLVVSPPTKPQPSTVSTEASTSTSQTEESSTSTQTSTATSSSDVANKGIDIAALQAGDASSLSGLWQSVYKDTAQELTINLKEYQISEKNGELVLTRSGTPRAGDATIRIVPKGVEASIYSVQASADLKTHPDYDRVIFSGPSDELFYRQADYENVENSDYSIKKQVEAQNTKSNTTSTSASSGTVADYQQVIDDNRTMLSTKSFDGLKFYSPEALQANELYYALYDFDNNGTKEFILTGKRTDFSSGSTTFDKLASWERMIYGVFTLKDKEIVTLFNGTGYRTQLVPMTDGSFWLRGSGGYDTGVYEHYSFSTSGTAVSKDVMITYKNLKKSNEQIQDESGKSYTWEELQAKVNQYDVLSSDLMEWHQL